MGKIIACLNQKGGVAKSTTVKNLSIGIAKRGKKVLAIDLDPAGGLTKSLGLDKPGEAGMTVKIFNLAIQGEDIPEGFGIVSCEEGIDFITSSNELKISEFQLISIFQRELVLKNYLEPIKNNYDYILIDCPGGLGVFTMNALFCADAIIIPSQAHFNSIEAMQNVFMEIGKARKVNGSRNKPELLGVLFTMIRDNTTNDREIMENLRETYSGKVRIFNTYIPISTIIPSSDTARKSVYKYKPNSSAAMVQMDLVNEVLGLLETE